MEKKFKFSDKPMTAKIVYGAVIGILCLTAIIIGIVAAASKPQELPDTPDTETPGDNNTPEDNTPIEPDNKPDEKPEDKPLSFVSPLVGTVVKEHDLSSPVFSDTLGAWRVHAGIDISAEDGANVYAAESGEISAIYSDPMLGYTVEITHKDGIKTRYSNLTAGSSKMKVGDAVSSGDIIGTVGDTSTSELADEPHLHFEMLVDGKKVNPLDHISEASKKASLGIE